MQSEGMRARGPAGVDDFVYAMIQEKIARLAANDLPSLIAGLELRPHGFESRSIEILSPRELDVFILLGLGCSNARIARQLGITERTVKTHVGHIIVKLGLESRLQIGLAAQVHIQSALPAADD